MDLTLDAVCTIFIERYVRHLSNLDMCIDLFLTQMQFNYDITMHNYYIDFLDVVEAFVMTWLDISFRGVVLSKYIQNQFPISLFLIVRTRVDIFGPSTNFPDRYQGPRCRSKKGSIHPV